MKKLDRELGLFSVFSISCGAMIGSGIFVLPGLAATIGGPLIYLAYLLAGLLVLPAALSKAEMSTAMPESGGTYIFLDRSLGPLAGTLTGIGTWLSLTLKSAFALVGFSAYLILFMDVSPSIASYFAVGIALFLVFCNCRGVEVSGQIQAYLVFVTLTALILFVSRGSVAIEKSHFQTLLPEGWMGFFSSMAFIFVSYAGVTKIASAAEEIKDPDRNIPWGIMLSLITMMLVYTLVTYVIVGVVPPEELGHGTQKLVPMAQAGGWLIGQWGEWIMAGVALMALSSMANAGILSSSRYPLALARDDLIPSYFTEVHEKYGTPIRAISLTGLVLIGFILFLPVKELAKLASAFKLLVFGAANIAVIVFRESEIEWYSPDFRSPLYPFIQLFGLTGSICLFVLMGYYDYFPLLGALFLVVLSLAWYLFYARNQTDRQGAIFRTPADQEEIKLFQRARSESKTVKESVIVPFFGLENDEMLHIERRIRLAASLCDAGERLDVVDFVEVPEQSFLSDADSESEEFRNLQQRVELLEGEIDNEIHVDQVITHSSRGALRNYAKEEKPHWVVFDWKEPSPWQHLIGIRKWWLEDFPCDLLFFQDNDRNEFNDILVITEPGPYDGEVIYAADHIARFMEGEITFMNPTSPENTELNNFVNSYQKELVNMCSVPSHVETIPVDNWIDHVLESAEDFDLLVIGGLTGENFPGFEGEKTDRRISREADCSVARVRSNLQSPKSVLSHRERGAIELRDYLTPESIEYGMVANNKDELFTKIAHRFIESGDSAERIKEALWEREKIQNTYIENNIAFPHGISEEVDKTQIKIFVLDYPVTYTNAGDTVNVCVATLGPPGEREIHLRLIGELSTLFVKGDLKRMLHENEDPESVIKEIQTFNNEDT